MASPKVFLYSLPDNEKGDSITINISDLVDDILNGILSTKQISNFIMELIQGEPDLIPEILRGIAKELSEKT